MSITADTESERLTFDMLDRDIEITLKRIIDRLIGDNDEKARGLIQVLRLVDRTDDDAKCYVISTAIMLAYSGTMHHENSLKDYLNEIESIGMEPAPIGSGPAVSPARKPDEDMDEK